MPFLIILGAIVSAIISYVILYFVIKAAVRDGIIEAHGNDDKTRSIYSGNGGENEIAQIVCPKCMNPHDIDFPKCPHCGYDY